MPAGDYKSLEPGPAGTFFAVISPPKVNPLGFGGISSINKWSMADRKATPFASGAHLAHYGIP